MLLVWGCGVFVNLISAFFDPGAMVPGSFGVRRADCTAVLSDFRLTLFGAWASNASPRLRRRHGLFCLTI